MPRLDTIDPTTDTGAGADILNGPLKEKQINIYTEHRTVHTTL